ncbi:hypothetical protein EV702DRAFT_1041804 [Suillus placidus]|uniref:Uncharacterized protein n=1 Tax=Suillus placidus TaxID=48579 RepID=A0A9P7D7N9_9AGAM|nr:hypothetical protein EV702DRAFT_1041804 [Suillus placidus]
MCKGIVVVSIVKLVDDFTALRSGFGIKTLRMKKTDEEDQFRPHPVSHLTGAKLAITCCMGCRRGQNKAQAAAVSAIPAASAAIPAAIHTAIPIPTAIPTAIPATIPAAIPATAAANATTFQHPRRQQLPVRYRISNAAHAGPDEGEVFDLNNVSGDEEELENLPAPAAMAPVGSNPSPLQTVTSTVRTDPLATGNLKQTKGPTDINHFYQIDPDTKRKTCIPCETLHEIDTTHKVMVYAGSTASSAPRTHAFTHHTELYLEAAEHFGWCIQIKDLNERLAEGWSLKTIREWLKKSPCTMQSLGPPLNKGIWRLAGSNLLTRRSNSGLHA